VLPFQIDKRLHMLVALYLSDMSCPPPASISQTLSLGKYLNIVSNVLQMQNIYLW
jgi:hypothetical protein